MIEKSVLIDYLRQGMTTREIAKKVGKGSSTIDYWINKYNIKEHSKYKKPQYKDLTYFNKINTKEKAYIIGFMLGDSCINKKDIVEISVALQDKEILDFIAEEIGCNVSINTTLNKKQRRFPKARIVIGKPQLTRDIIKLFGGRSKEERRIPIIPERLERYLVQGFFDAEGCITWGFRKDRNRLWQKISFTSQLKMLQGIQKILLKQDIATLIRPKSGEKCYIMEFSDKLRVLKFLDYIYPDDGFIILKRKYKKAQALRLELGEFGGA